MTRETKIGLLVGLTFIIIVGILLSEPLSHSNESQPAQLPIVGPNVRAGVTTPGAAQPPISMVDAGNVAPRQRVPMQREIASRTQNSGGGVISIGPGNTDNGGSGRIEVGISGRQPAPQENYQPPQDIQYQPPRPPSRTGNGDGAVTLENGSHASGSIDLGATLSNAGRGIPGDLAREAARHGEGLGPANERGQNAGSNRPNPLPANSRQYTAGAGDSLSKIAAKFYGSNSKANRDAIVVANPSLAADPNKIISGRTYILPNVPATPGSNTTGGTTNGGNSSGGSLRELTPPIRAAAPPAPVPAAPAGYVYTVKENDNLWKIAKEQLNDPGAIASIKELNKDVLGSSDQVRPNMKLRLPSKPVN